MWTPAERKTVLNRYVQQILSVKKPLGIILFGSEARGDINEDSDLDLVIVDDTVPCKRRSVPFLMAIRPRKIPVDVLVLTPEEIRNGYQEEYLLFTDIVNEGQWIFGDPQSAGLGNLGKWGEKE